MPDRVRGDFRLVRVGAFEQFPKAFTDGGAWQVPSLGRAQASGEDPGVALLIWGLSPGGGHIIAGIL